MSKAQKIAKSKMRAELNRLFATLTGRVVRIRSNYGGTAGTLSIESLLCFDAQDNSVAIDKDTRNGFVRLFQQILTDQPLGWDNSRGADGCFVLDTLTRKVQHEHRAYEPVHYFQELEV